MGVSIDPNLIVQPATDVIIMDYSSLIKWIAHVDENDWISDVCQNRIANEIYNGPRPPFKTNWKSYLDPWRVKIEAFANKIKSDFETFGN